jgi:hypothetical protein
VSDTYKASYDKCFQKIVFSLLMLFLDTYKTYLQELKMCENNNIDQRGLKALHFDYNIFSFLDSRWINKYKILSYLVFKLFFLRNTLLNLDLHISILILNLYLLCVKNKNYIFYKYIAIMVSHIFYIDNVNTSVSILYLMFVSKFVLDNYITWRLNLPMNHNQEINLIYSTKIKKSTISPLKGLFLIHQYTIM